MGVRRARTGSRRSGLRWAGPTVGGLLVTMAVAVTGAVGRPAPAVAAPSFSPSDIVDEYIAGGDWYGVVSADWLPDGRMLAAQLAGSVYVIDPAAGTSSVFFTIPDAFADGEAGLLDVTVDPGFAQNGYFYAYLSNTARRLEVSRFQFLPTGAATLASRTTLWQSPGPLVSAAFHIGGSINIGPDGKLYVTTGDNLDTTNSQSLGNVFGKVLRLNIDGTVPADDPFADGAGPNIDEIWAYGLRNSYRSSFDPVTGDYWVADVGGNDETTAYEEINLVTKGANYGWPLCEGPLGPPKNGASCPAGVTGPIFSYPHNAAVACCTPNKAIIGGSVYRGTTFPSFAGTYVYADYAAGEIYWAERSAGGVVSGLLEHVMTEASPFMPVWVDVSPVDGQIYWLSLGQDGKGQLRRLRYTTAGHRPPVIDTAAATTPNGELGMPMSFTAGATDGDGDVITYQWDFGDLTSSTLQNPNHTYATSGVYQVRLSASSGGETVKAPPITVQVGSRPVVAIAAPPGGVNFSAGQVIDLTGSATDVLDGAIPAASLHWTVVFDHDNHTHPMTSGVGTHLTLPIPTSGHDYSGATGYTVTLTATDSLGLTGRATLDLVPNKVVVPVTSNVATTVALNGIVRSMPTNLDTILGFETSVSVAASVCDGTTSWKFSSWSNGGSRDQTFFIAPSLTSLRADYVANGACGGTVEGSVPSTPSTPSIPSTPSTPSTPTSTSTRAPIRPLAAPGRLVDTRPGGSTFDGRFQAIGPLAAGTVLRVPVGGRAGVGLDSTAVALNVTAVDAADAGYLAVYPCDSISSARPGSSNVNYQAHTTVPNAVLSKVGAGVAICVFTSSTTHLVLDVSASFGVDSGLVTLPRPARILETRPGAASTVDGVSSNIGHLEAGSTTRLGVAGRAGIAVDATTAVLNVTAISAGDDGFLTVFPCRDGRPDTSNVNFHQGQVIADLVLARIGPDGGVCLYTSAALDVAVDVTGAFSGSAAFTPLPSPVRYADTRDAAPSTFDGRHHGGGRVAAGSTTRITVAGRGQVPVGAAAIAVNVAAVDPLDAGYLSVTSCAGGSPAASNLNVRPGSSFDVGSGTVANAVVTSMSASGDICVYSSVATDVLVDVAGWFTGAS